MILQNDCIIFCSFVRNYGVGVGTRKGGEMKNERRKVCNKSTRNEMFIQIILNKKFMNPFPTNEMSRNHSTQIYS